MTSGSDSNRLRREDPPLLRGRGRFVANLVDASAAHVVYVVSDAAHALITSIDASDAWLDGVLGIYTATDIDLVEYPQQFAGMNREMVRPMLARDRVRFVGEPIVAVVAESVAIASDAAQQVVVELEPLPAVVDAETAGAAGHLLFPDITDPLAFRTSVGTAPDFDACEVVVHQRMVNQRVAAAPMEPRSGLASWTDGRLTHVTAGQAVHETKAFLAELYGLDPARVRVVAYDVGGSFGAKFRPYPEEALLGWFAQRLGRPVTWTETRSHSMLGLAHGRAQIQYVTIGGRRDGTITSFANRVVQDSGAYPLVGAVLPSMTQLMLTGVYAIEEAAFSAESVVTNTTPVGAYRGAGRPEATAAIERAVDLFAAECGLDPVSVRRRNLVPSDAFPYRTASGAVYDSGDYASALDAALDAVDYDRVRRLQRERRAAGAVTQIGIGVATYVEVTASTPAADLGAIELRSDGRIVVRASSTPHGQGHATVWSMLVADALGIAEEAIDIVAADTDEVRRGVVTGGSRSAQIVGSLVHRAAELLIERAREATAGLLEAAVADVELDRRRGAFHVRGTPSVALTWADLGQALGGLVAESDASIPGSTFPFGAHIAVVEVDVETGDVRVTRFVAVDDAGPVLHPAIFDGQIHGGLAGGIAQAMLEEVVYDEIGNPRTANLADYAMISAVELPSFELVRSETPSPNNPLGVKGIGESGAVGSTVAVQNAVVDAVAHLGVRHIDLPLTPERVWRAIREARGGPGPS